MTCTRHLRKGVRCWNCDNICPAPSQAKNWLCANDKRGALCPECNPNPKSQTQSRRRENPILDNNPSARDLLDKAYLITQHCGRKRPTAQDAILAALIQGRI